MKTVLAALCVASVLAFGGCDDGPQKFLSEDSKGVGLAPVEIVGEAPVRALETETYWETWRREFFTMMAGLVPNTEHAKCKKCRKNNKAWIVYKHTEFCYAPSYQEAAGSSKTQGKRFCENVDDMKGTEFGFPDNLDRCIADDFDRCGFKWWACMLIVFACFFGILALVGVGYIAGKKM